MIKEREALEFIAAHDFDGAADFVIARIAEVLVLKAKEALAEQPERQLMTVEGSLRFRLDSEKQKSADLLDDVRELKGIIEKLRAAQPKPQPEQEPVGFAVMERPWVGLTEVDILAESKHWRNPEDFRCGVYLAADTLKEKNT